MLGLLPPGLMDGALEVWDFIGVFSAVLGVPKTRFRDFERMLLQASHNVTEILRQNGISLSN